MNFNIESTIKDMVSAIKNATSWNEEEISEVTIEFLNRRKSRMQLLVEMRLNGEISQSRLESRLEDEKKIFEAELNTLAAMNKVLAQKAANAAIDVLVSAVKALL